MKKIKNRVLQSIKIKKGDMLLVYEQNPFADPIELDFIKQFTARDQLKIALVIEKHGPINSEYQRDFIKAIVDEKPVEYFPICQFMMGRDRVTIVKPVLIITDKKTHWAIPPQLPQFPNFPRWETISVGGSWTMTTNTIPNIHYDGVSVYDGSSTAVIKFNDVRNTAINSINIDLTLEDNNSFAVNDI